MLCGRRVAIRIEKGAFRIGEFVRVCVYVARNGAAAQSAWIYICSWIEYIYLMVVVIIHVCSSVVKSVRKQSSNK